MNCIFSHPNRTLLLLTVLFAVMAVVLPFPIPVQAQSTGERQRVFEAAGGLAGAFRTMAFHEGRLYVAHGIELSVIVNPEATSDKAVVKTANAGMVVDQLIVLGGLIYALGDGGSKISIFSISAEGQLTTRSSLTQEINLWTNPPWESMTVLDSVVYVLSPLAMTIIVLDSSGYINGTDKYPCKSGSICSFVMSENGRLLMVRTEMSKAWVVMLDVTKPRAPQVVGEVPLALPPDFIMVSDNVIFAYAHPYESPLAVLEVLGPVGKSSMKQLALLNGIALGKPTPTVYPSLAGLQIRVDMTVVNGQLLIASDREGIAIVNVKATDAPFVVRSFENGLPFRDLESIGDSIALLDWRKGVIKGEVGADGVQLRNTLLQTRQVTAPVSVVVVDKMAAVLSNPSRDKLEIQLVNTSSPDHLEFLGPPVTIDAKHFVIEQTRLTTYGSDIYLLGDGSVRVYRVDSHQGLDLLSVYSLPGGAVMDLLVVGGRAYLLRGNSPNVGTFELAIADIDNRAQFKLIEVVRLPVRAKSLLRLGDEKMLTITSIGSDATSAQLALFDLRRSSRPLMLDSVVIDDVAGDLIVRGRSILHVGLKLTSITIDNVGNLQPTTVWSVNGPFVLSRGKAVLCGSLVCVLSSWFGSTWIDTFDWTTSERLEWPGYFSSFGLARAISPVDDRIMVADEEVGLAVYEISKRKPKLTGELIPATPLPPRSKHYLSFPRVFR